MIDFTHNSNCLHFTTFDSGKFIIMVYIFIKLPNFILNFKVQNCKKRLELNVLFQ